MKHLFGIFIPLCICSFIAFGISVAIMGVQGSAAAEGSTVDITEDSWTRTLEGEYSDIDIDAGGLTVKLIPADTDVTTIKYEGHSVSSNIKTEIKGDTLKIDTGTFISFMGINKLIDNIVKGIENGFVFDFTEASLEITVPAKVYDKLDINEGSGNITVNGIEAMEYDIDIGSGALYFTGGDVTAEKLDLDHGSGYFSLKNIRTEKYEIDVGSGKFDISGLTGKGEFSMGSGTGTLGYGIIDGNSEIDIGSGSLTVELPTDTNAVITADIGSGSVKVNACGVNIDLANKQKITLGGGGYEIKTELGSGSVKFVDADSAGNNTDEYSEAVVTTSLTGSAEPQE
ncbi:MAG: DUF4097 family beta strand repeat-containing protein [Oscillospiraceae bacterium]